MKLLCDEAVEGQIVQRLRDDGHEVLYVAEMSSGISDDEILELSNNQEAVLVTPDKDFGELVFRLERASFGVILTRVHGISGREKAAAVASAIRDHEEEMEGAFSVIEPGKIRIRRAFP